jgi:beta-N-acetylhexosaminidase
MWQFLKFVPAGFPLYDARMRNVLATFIAFLSAAIIAAQPPSTLDRDAQKWVQTTFKKLTLDEKIGQMIVSAFASTFIPSDSEEYDRLSRLVSKYRIGGFHVFGGSEPIPPVLLNPTYGSVILGQPLEAASMHNRLQAISPVPLLNSADFETGVGMRINGATTLPKAMAFGAAGDETLAYEAGRISAVEARAIGVHVNFAPVVDVNNNPRNPVINVRSFGEDPARVGALGAAFVRGMQSAGAIATLKHFPGHGDTDVDSHLGLPVIQKPREQLDRMELAPFRAGIAAEAGAVMSGHIEVPALDPAKNTPGTLSRPMVTGLLRQELGFKGLIYTDSMGMAGVTQLYDPAEAAVRAVKAGNDVILHSPDDEQAFEGIKAAVAKGEIPVAQIDASVMRILEAKARVGLHKSKLVNLESVPAIVGSRAHKAVAAAVSQRSITLIRDERNDVPLRLAKDAQVLHLSALDYPSGWRIAAPSRTFIPELRNRYPNVTAIELSDRTTPSEMELVRAMAPRFDAVIVGTFVRAASASGRMDLSPPIVRLLNDIARRTAESKRPFVTVMFGNPYTALFLKELPAVMLTYDFYDLAEMSAVRALTGEAAIGGKLPVALPELFAVGHGLTRPGPVTSSR